ncbi:MAG: isoleucine--tRNA ligase [Candidatus Aminicenantes bacterium]|nr:isoleucine--tRNA ligase [Candidatus Aminicenantes bacterium]NIM82136.1 isoleucine--tRNA ligase [Candidatus Aminicenantes bacterium]NIN21533.1 isoleucine--tRNA ligase [Candidatus Aminicenantes bacterium]NIN45342.1 isoleucine--tRNA ligase [Candidatus Aminicenantes bacterium]NIN88163.1 isoleucine--tRNA ligase [Candidatus Aminicenantes bacterium]
MTDEKKIKWKNTLNLPQTDFPMKAQLNRKEPQILNKWKELDIYHRILEKRKDADLYILHDGPPYANGNIHLGHALNKILKDFIVKTKTMEGFQAPYVPGWDCHGLPIEIKVDKQLGPKKQEMNISDIRRKCREYAEKFINIQREEFMRLGVFGEWNNPYTTLDPIYESTVINYFKSFVKNNNVLRKKRPVYWCTSCATALAEAEVEYANHTSPSIYVKFLLKDIPGFLEKFKDKEIFVLIWTTTPWTIPANLAIAVQPEYDYALFELNGEYYIAAARLIPVIAELTGGEYKLLKEFKGKDLNGLNTLHPLYNRNSIIINTDYVELDQGTGCVHTAPGHGEEDYKAGLDYGLDIYSPVDSAGLFDDTTGKYKGKHIFKSNAEIVEDLRTNNRLVYDTTVEHSYPHCWRCKKPVIFRATEQWFIAMDTADLRKNALEEIRQVRWLPKWGEERIYNMVATRPDWCISRQRDWGVPIPVFYCKDCGEPLLSLEAVQKTEEQFRVHGSDSWYTGEISEFLPAGTTCSNCGSKNFKKGMDIIDVWFESGSSFNVMENYRGHRFPADMYLEGGDQYRGWFHSSLLVAVSAKEQSPYKTVITHGWALDEQGRAMSKSLGNVMVPQTIINEKGAEILRLWVAMVNYREDIRLGNEILSRVTESYRKIRNTWKFMLGVLSDFNPEIDTLKDQNLREVDLYILSKLQQVKKKILQSYQEFEYHIIYHTISNFFTVDLSAFYLNIMKDNLYCSASNSTSRKTAQAVIFKLLKETVLLLAPVLSFTCEEVWEHMPEFRGKEASVHLHRFPEVEKKYLDRLNTPKWEDIIALRDRILKEVEEARNQKIIGDSLEAEIDMDVSEKHYDLVSGEMDLFKEILVVSKINVKQTEADETRIHIRKSGGKKCPRCWNWFTGDTSENKFPDLCLRCNHVVKEMNIDAEE